MSTPVTGSNATEQFEADNTNGIYLTTIIVKLLLYSEHLQHLDDEEKEALADHVVDILNTDMV
jgi:hypothetical protein